MTLQFKQEKLWSIVEGTKEKPESDDETWEEKDLVSWLEIMTHLENQQANTIRKCKTSSETWKKLQSELEPKTNGNQVMTLISQLTLKMEDEDEMLASISKHMEKEIR